MTVYSIEVTNTLAVVEQEIDRGLFIRLNDDGSVCSLANTFLQTNCGAYYIVEKQGISSSFIEKKEFELGEEDKVKKEIKAWLEEGFWMITNWPDCPGRGLSCTDETEIARQSALDFFITLRNNKFASDIRFTLTETNPTPQADRPMCYKCRINS